MGPDPLPQGHDYLGGLSWCPSQPGRLLCGSYDGRVYIWEADSTTLAQFVDGNAHSGAKVEDVDWVPASADEFGSVGDNGTVRLWDLRKKDPVSGQCVQSDIEHCFHAVLTLKIKGSETEDLVCVCVCEVATFFLFLFLFHPSFLTLAFSQRLLTSVTSTNKTGGQLLVFGLGRACGQRL